MPAVLAQNRQKFSRRNRIAEAKVAVLDDQQATVLDTACEVANGALKGGKRYAVITSLRARARQVAVAQNRHAEDGVVRLGVFVFGGSGQGEGHATVSDAPASPETDGNVERIDIETPDLRCREVAT